MTTLFVDNLTIVDFSYLDSQRGIVGESWITDVELTGTLDECGFIFDFSLMKKRIKQLLDRLIDHTLLIPLNSSGLICEEVIDAHHVTFQTKQGALKLISPTEALFLAPVETVEPEAIAEHLAAVIQAEMPANVQHVTLTFRSENTGNDAYYHYTHGLPKHDGNCQRIAHGHRSRIDIRINGHRSEKWEQYWAEQFNDRYIGTISHICYQDDANIAFEYTSTQGYFKLTLPVPLCHLIRTETTVEQIAHYIYNRIIENEPDLLLEVRAFEGIQKGAISRI